MADTPIKGGSATPSASAESGPTEVFVLPEDMDTGDLTASRFGEDLVLVDAEGEEAVVEGFYSTASPPTVISAGGQIVPADFIEALPDLADIQLAQGTDPVGTVTTVRGDVFVLRADGTSIALEAGDPIFEGDVLQSLTGGAVGGVLVDDSAFSFSGDAELTVNEVAFDEQTEEGEIHLSVSRGTFTFASGRAAQGNADAMTVDTPYASLTLRDSQVGVDVADGQPLNVVLIGTGDGVLGEVVVANGVGAQVLSLASQALSVSGIDAAPTTLSGSEAEVISGVFETAFRAFPDTPSERQDIGDIEEGPQGDGGNADDDIDLGDIGDDENLPGGGGDLDDVDIDDIELASGDADEIDPFGPDDETAPDAGETNDPAANGPTDLPIQAQPNNGEPGVRLPQTQSSQGFNPTVPAAGQQGALTAGGTQNSGAASNADPVAANSEVSGVEDNVIGGTLAATDADGDSISFDLAAGGAPLHGTVSIASDGTYAYVPNADFSGTDSFTYSVADGRGGTDTASVAISVSGIADAPIVSATNVTGTETQAIALDISALLSDTDGSESLAVTIDGIPAGAVLSAGTDNGGGSWSVAAEDLSSLTLTVPAGAKGDHTLSVTAVSTETDGDSATTSKSFDVTVDRLLTNSLQGTAGNDTLRGTEQNDAIAGYDGNDRLYGRGGHDDLTGDADNDQLYGEAGDDVLTGGAGNDRLIGGDGADQLRGGDGADYLYVDAADTVIDGGAGSDRLYVQGTAGVSVDLAAASIELAYGAAGDDTFDGSGLTDNTSLYGRDGDDALSGGSGNDRLYGEAGDDVLSGGAGNDRLIGGDGADQLRGGDGADYLYVDAADTVIDGGAGSDRLYVQGTAGVSVDLAAAGIELAYGAAGDDVFDGSNLSDKTSLYGRDGDDALSGGSGNDRIYGEAGDDVLSGGAGNDRLIGGDGADELRGGDGADYLYVDADDTVIDGGAGSDRLYVQGTAGVSVDLAAAGIELAYGAAGDDTFDGSGLTDNTSLYGRDGDDALSGGSGNDRIYGEAGDDVLSGGAGNDRLIGGDGADQLRGGDGADYLYVDAADTVIDGGAGSDRLYVQGTAGVSVDLAAAGIELAYGAAGDDTFDGSGLTDNTSLYGRDGDDALSGGSGNDRLYGEAGDDVLAGGAGNDRLIGGDGADQLRGGDGADYLYVDAADTVIDGGAGSDRLYVQGTAGVSVDLAAASIELAYGAAGDDVFDGSNLTDNTSLYGRDGDDALSGGSGNDRLYGEAGDDVLAGGAGNDRLIGGDGADQLRGGDGADYLYVDAADTVIDGGAGSDRLYVQGTAGVSVDLAAAGIELAYGAAGDDTFDGSGLTDNTSLYGRDGDDALSGGSGNDRLYGEAGDDVLAGGAGNDRLIGDDGADQLRGGDGADYLYVDAADTVIDGGAGSDRLYVQGTAGVSVDLAAASIELAYGAAGDDTFDGSGLTDNTSLYGRDGDDALSGGSGNDRLYGEAGDDVLAGGAGNDRLIGGDGADQLRGGDGADYLYVDAADTVIDGGAGSDRLYVQGTAGVSVDLAAAGIELAYGAAGDDTFDGSGLTDNTSLYGRDGDDALSGGSGNDRLYGEAGDDVLAGGAGNDRLIGGDGADQLRGGDGADYLYVDAADTVIDGGAGSDRLYVQGTAGVSVDLAAAGIELAYGAAGDDTFDGSGLTDNTSLYGRDGDDALSGGSGNDRIYGEAGDDVLSGGAGNDRLYGGSGNDTFIIRNGDGADRIYDFAEGDTLQFIGPEFSAGDMTFTQIGNDAAVTFAGIDGLEVRLSGVSADDLSGAAADTGDAIVISVDPAI